MKRTCVACLMIFIHSFNFICCEDNSLHQNVPRYDLVHLVRNSADQISKFQNLQIALATGNTTVFNDVNIFVDKPLKELLLEFSRVFLSHKCFKDFIYVFQNLRSSIWALKFFDAYGKVESGVLQGNFRWFGDYRECTEVYAPPKYYTDTGDFHGKYCSLEFAVPVQNYSLPLTIGICIPETCNPPQNLFHKLSSSLQFSDELHELATDTDSFLNSTKITCQVNSKKLTNEAICVICLIAVFAFLSIVGSMITIYENYVKSNAKSSDSDTEEELITETGRINSEGDGDDDDEVLLISTSNQNNLPPFVEKMKLFFNCFCFITNGKHLLSTSSSEGQLPCLNGIRFLSMSWVILCHVYAFGFSVLRSPLDQLYAFDNWSFQVILNGFFSVDSFFLLSGFLQTYLFLQQSAKNNGKISWVYLYVHRYLRLTPVYMVVLAFNATLFPYLGSGPIWGNSNIDPICQKNWWWNLLYINNFLNSTDQCMGWSWYLANDMQFFAVSPLILIPLWRWPKIGYVVLGMFLFGTFLANIIITCHYNLIAGLGNVTSSVFNDLPNFMSKFSAFFDKIYVKPYTRMSPYLVGIAVAFIFYKWKQNGIGKMKPLTLTLGWIIGSTITLACIFGTFHQNISVDAAAMYNAFSRAGFACGLSWVIFVCCNGQGGLVNVFLSWKIWIPLSRLTFCAYLLHPIIELAYFFSVKSLISFSHISSILSFLGFLCISYGAAFVTSLLFESPIIRLEKCFQKKFSKQQ